MSEPTKIRLARALGAIPGVPRDMIDRALDGHYDDYLSDLAFPLSQLVGELRELTHRPTTPRDSRALLRDLIDHVKDGEFDGTKEESDAWARSPEGQEAFRELMGGA